MIRLLSTTLALAALLAFSPAARAEDLPQPPEGGAMVHHEGKRHEMHEKWQHMTPEEKAAKRAELKEKYDKLPPEQQEKVKERIAERREHRGDHREDKHEDRRENRHENNHERHRGGGHR